LYDKLIDLAIGLPGQKILDLGTGSGVFPRAMYHHGAEYIGVDVAAGQIEVARKLADQEQKEIQFEVAAAEELDFPDHSFDAITAIQCWLYFDLEVLIPKIRKILRPQGKLAIVYMHWLFEADELVRASEDLILKYNPGWSGARFPRFEPKVADFAEPHFEPLQILSYDAHIPFTSHTWMGRIRASRGIGATLSPDQIQAFDQEHRQLIKSLRPDQFTVLHQVTMTVYQLKN
ncbi:MAG: methyltransferase domain-containing protein, partial [Bacteroidota bacterium]